MRAAASRPCVNLQSRDDQGQIGSCVGHCTEGAFRNLLAHEGVADFAGSRPGLYYCARALEHDIAQDAGAQFRGGVKAAANTGVMREALWRKGFCYLPKAYCMNPQLASDWWVLRRA